MNEIIQPKIHSGHIECAVANLFDFRKYIIVPNVSHGWDISHEADLLAVYDNKVTEIEVKISLSDLKADFKKPKHISALFLKNIGRLIYAIPIEIYDKAVEIIPKQYGIITIKWNGYRYEAQWQRQARHRKDYKGISDNQLINLLRLGCMRIWSLKSINNRPKRTIKKPNL